MNDFPTGWITRSIRSLFEIKYGKGLLKEKRDAKGEYHVYGSNGVVGRHSSAITVGETIIIGRKGSVGKVHRSQNACWPIDTTYYIDEFPENFPSKYWAYVLQSLSLGQKEQSSAIPGINRDEIYAIEVSVPPLNEQKRIVEKLEKLLGRVEAVQARLDKIPAILKRFRQSVLAAACSGKLTADWRREESLGEQLGNVEIPNSWKCEKLPDLGFLGRGRSRHRPRDAEHLYGGPYPFIQTGAVARAGGRITQHTQTYSEAGLAQSKLWETGTVCITIAANIADSAILTYPACFPDSVVGFVADPEKCVTEFVEFFIRTARSDLSNFAPATAQKNINLSILNEVLVPTPPVEEQKEIVRRVEELFAFADTVEERYTRARAHTDKLTQSILAKAFRGELVPQDPNDEPHCSKN